MRDSNLDLSNPRPAIMVSESSADHGPGDFGFAFNDSNFSDRLLRIEILSEPLEFRPDGERCTSLAHWATNRKRRREDTKKENVSTPVDIAARYPKEQILTQPDHIPNNVENQEEETAAAMIEVSPSDECMNNNYSSWSMDCSSVVRVKNVHISSPILAARSPFFYKLFSNGMRESEQRHVYLRINASEEAALMELLNFMYSNKLKVTTAPALLDVLMVADKFEVASCMRFCSRLLRNLPMTPESALLFLDLPSSVSMAEAVQPLTDAAKQFLAVRYKDLTKFPDELLNMRLAGVEAILSSDDLQVASEDVVYDFVLKWARIHYSKIEDRHEIFRTRLAKLIRFPYMTYRKLNKVLTCNDFDHDVAQKLVIVALFYKADACHKQRTHIGVEISIISHRFAERAYKYRPVKVIEFEHPHQQCVVYLDLKREECASLFPSGRLYSQVFHLGGQGFFLSANCNMDE